MSITFRCPSCESTRRVSESMAGRRVRCPDCDEMVEVPAASNLEEDGGPLDEETGGDDLPPLELDGVPEVTPSMLAANAGLQPAGDVNQDHVVYDDEDYDEDDYDDEDDDDYDDEDDDYYDDDDDDDGAEHDDAGLLGDRPERPEGEMDMTPMVDVTFLLLIFFMVTAAFSLQKSIEIPKPEQTDEPSTNVQEIEEETPDIVTVQIDEYNTFTVLTPDWEREAPGEMDLLARLREAREGNTDGIIPNQLLVKAHGECLHKRVVMALDAGSETGFESVQLMTVDGEF